MNITAIFPISSRQKRSLVFLLIAIEISWCCCYWVISSFTIFTLTQILTSGALIYSNKTFLKYTIRQSVIVAFVLIIIFSLGAVVADWFKLIDSYVNELAFSYLQVIFTLKIIQKQIKLSWPQLLVGAVLIVINFCFVHDNPAFTDSQSFVIHNTPFFFDQLSTGIFAVSMLIPANEESSAITFSGEPGMAIRFRDKPIFQFLTFTLLTLIGLGILYSLTLIKIMHPKDKLIADFEAKTGAFYDIKKYVDTIDPEHKVQEIDFNIDDGMFYITVDGKNASNNYNDMDSWKPPDSLLKATPWTKASFTVLKEKLAYIDCRSIKTGEPFVIEHKAIDYQSFYYNLFERTTDYLSYSDTCKYVRYNGNVIIEFKHLSQFDSDCFPQ